jgi:dihydrofolate synthase/folylpolyglutamate synthase
MSFYEALAARTTVGIKFELARMRRFLAACGDPHQRFVSVLVAGTNGKGSVAAMWGAGLRASGRRVGLYTSPHLVHYRERMQVGAATIDDDTLTQLYEELLALERTLGETLTFFEATTLFALQWFAASGVDTAVLEVGMGGRLDATNVVEPALSIITTIGHDHQDFLGETLAEIAREKAGVLRPGIWAAIGEVPDEAWQAIAAAQPEAKRIGLGRDVSRGEDWIEFTGYRMRDLHPRLYGAHQAHNAALFAMSALLPSALQLSEGEIRAGLSAPWPGRYDKRQLGERTVVIDGAHNPEGVRALVAALRADTSLPTPRTLIFGALQGRHREEMLPPLAAFFDEVLLVAPASPRAMPPEALHALYPQAATASSLAEAFARAQGRSICVAGSLYLVGEALAFLSGEEKDSLADYR